MIAYSCNLSCAGCISLSDRPRRGVATTADIIDWVDTWSAVVEPEILSVFGGEPCLHPDLILICNHVRKAWPKTVIRLITNGYLLNNFDSTHWFNLGKFEIQVSVHRQDHESLINNKIKDILKHKKDWRVSMHGGADHKQIAWTSGDVSVYKSIFKDFVVPYKEKLLPWNSDPAEAHKICGSPATPILYQGKLYKCPAIANIIDLTGSNYAGYQGLLHTDRLDDFVANIGQPEAVCGYCPDKSQAVIIDHMNIKNVTVKQKISY